MWGFATHPPRMVEAAPKHDEFFLASVPEQAHALVREVTQNSADAIREGVSQVQLYFHFVEVDRATFHSRYLKVLPPPEGLTKRPVLREHCAAAGMLNIPMDENVPVRLLVIEDFGTTGLNGGYKEHEESSSFQAFWKRYGTSNKGDDRGGRHGIGKSVVPSSSRLHAFFGVTKRSEDGAELLMGQIVLRPHRIGEKTYDSFGQFSPSGEEEWAMPYDSPDVIAQAKEDFKLKRTDEPGLSLVVPYVLSSITEEALTRAAVEHCFHQILAGDLRIFIGNVDLSKDTLLDFVDTLGDPALRAAARLSAEAADKNLPKFKPNATPVKGRLSADYFDDKAIEAMRQLFDAGKTVCVQVPIEIRVRGKDTAETGEVTLYLRRATDSDAVRETYVRGRVTVPHQHKQLGGAALVGLLVAEDGPASKFLGDSEDVAHTKWVKNKLLEKYVAPATAFDVVKSALKELKKILVGEGEDQHVKDLLKDYFWQPKPSSSDKGGGNKPPTDIEPNKPVFTINEVAGGFVAEIKELPDDEEISASIEVAYAVRRGPVGWTKEDFVIGKDITVTRTGVGEIEFENNKIIVSAARRGLRVKALGFDPNRDLLMRVRALDETEV